MLLTHRVRERRVATVVARQQRVVHTRTGGEEERRHISLAEDGGVHKWREAPSATLSRVRPRFDEPPRDISMPRAHGEMEGRCVVGITGVHIRTAGEPGLELSR